MVVLVKKTPRAVIGPPVRVDGQDRHYVLNWAELIGLRIKRSAKGNIIHSATFGGTRMGQHEARRLAAVKVWIGADDSVHVDGSIHDDIVHAVEAAL